MSLRAGTVLLVVGIVGFLAASSVTASGVRDPFGGAGDDEQRAVDLLRRSADAMRTTSYSGTRMLSAWGRRGSVTVLADVDHVAGQGTRVSVRGGPVPGGSDTFYAPGAGQATLTPEAFTVLTDAYAVRLGRRDTVAGRASTVVEVSRSGRVAAQLWIDDRSGLLLRRELFDHTGSLVRESTFIDLDVHARTFLAHLPPMPPLGASTVGTNTGPEAAERSGWSCPRQAGTMRLLSVETLARGDATQVTYSDGLSRLSVFEQHGSLDPAAVQGYDRLALAGRPVYVREGMPTYAMWEDDGRVLTVVTDASLDDVRAVVARTTSHDRAADGFWRRVASGLARLGEWASPML